MKVVPIPQLMDNYAYLIVDEATTDAAIVDCAEADPVLATVDREGATLRAILPTHHHYDHVGGHADLVAKIPGLKVFGADDRIPERTAVIRNGDRIQIGGLQARVLTVPAHTTGHVAYYFQRSAALFTGDTLFAGGCGRLFEGDAGMMLASLTKLRALPDDTVVYFGHEYTEQNLRFALTLEPNNSTLKKKYEWAAAQNKARRPTTPTTIGSEKETNPFLRWESLELRATLRQRVPGLPDDDVSVFARIRELKDAF